MSELLENQIKKSQKEETVFKRKKTSLENMIQCNYLNLYVLEEDFEDTKGVIRIRKSTTQWPKGQTTIYITYT